MATRSRSRHCLMTKGARPVDVDPQDDVRDAAGQLADLDLGIRAGTRPVSRK